MSPNLMQQLESLSGYRQIYPPQDPKALLNPVAFSHIVLTVAGRRCHVLSRIGDAGLDYTQRTNKFAHHVVLDAAEVPAAGPAWLLATSGFMRGKWEGDPSNLPTGPAIPLGDSPPRVCRAWQQLTGDAGWGGVLAETAPGTGYRPAVLVFKPGMDVLALLAETMALLPAELRWQVSFSTYCTTLPAGVACQWRCVVEGSPEEVAIRRAAKDALIIDLCRPLGLAAGGAYVDAARTGKALPSLPAPQTSAIATDNLQFADIELEQALQETGKSPTGAGLRQRTSPNANIGKNISLPPSSIPWEGPPTFQQRRFKRKPPPRWPWVLGIMALIMIVVALGITLKVFVDKVAADKVAADNKVAADKVAAEKKAVEDKVAADKVAADNKVAADKVAAEKKAAEDKVAAEKAANDPLRHLRNIKINMPKYKFVSAVGPSVDQQKPFEIGSLNKDVFNQCSISFVGDDTVFTDNTKVEVKYNVGKTTWECGLSKTENSGAQAGAQILIASLQIKNNKLTIKWADIDKANENTADLLRNCLLKIKLPNQTPAFVSLREPKDSSPLDFTMLHIRQNLDKPNYTIEFDGPPKRIPVMLNLEKELNPGRQEPGKIIPMILADLTDSTLLGKDSDWSMQVGKSIPLHFRISIKRSDNDGEKFQVELRYLGVHIDDDEQWPNIYGIKSGQLTLIRLNEIDQNSEERSNRQDELEKVKIEKKKALDEETDKKVKKDIQKEIEDLDGQINKIKEHIRKVKNLRETYIELQQTGKLNFRIYMTIAGHDIDLARTKKSQE